MEQAGDDGMRSRLRLAAEQLYEDTRLRDALDDDQASRLLAWGYREIERVTKEPGARVENAVGALLEERAETVREVVGRINRFMESYAQWDEAERQNQVAALLNWLCRVRPDILKIGDVMRLETLPAGVKKMGPERIFSLLLAALTGDEET